jgi:hypothetical protein
MSCSLPIHNFNPARIFNTVPLVSEACLRYPVHSGLVESMTTLASLVDKDLRNWSVEPGLAALGKSDFGNTAKEP